MAHRPYWSGQIRLSLVTLPVQLFTAVRSSASAIDLDQIDRESGERVHHQNVLEDGTPVERENIIKGYKHPEGGYVLLEPEEIEAVKLPSSDIFELRHFVDLADLPLAHLEKPYYVVPDGSAAGEIYTVIRDALKATKKAGLGQIALRGREEFCALIPHGKGMIVEILRYAPEVRDEDEYFSGIKQAKPRSDYLALAKKLIEQNSGAFDAEMFTDHYHEALMELIKAKEEDRAPEYEEARPAPEKIIDLMDALKKSLEKSSSKSAAPRKSSTSAKSRTTPHKGSKPAGRKRASAKSTSARKTGARKHA